MAPALPLHLALHLVPYLDPTDIGRACRVCRSWYNVFASPTLAQTALRIHYPLSYEVRAPSHPLDYTIFARVSKRYNALKSGVPNQELRIPITKTRRNLFVWTFSENLIVLQSAHYPEAVLSFIYLDERRDSRRIRNGKLVLGVTGETVTKVKVCRDVLVVERTSPTATGPGRADWICSVHCFRLSLSPSSSSPSSSGESEVIATKISTFETFEFSYIDYSHQVISDHSGKYYAAFSRTESWRIGGVVQVWDITTGESVLRIAAASFPEISNVANVVVIAKQGPSGPQQVVLIGNDQRKNHPTRWGKFPGEWGYLSNYRVFNIDGVDREAQEWGGFVGRNASDQGPPQHVKANSLARAFKVPRSPAGITVTDDPSAAGYESEEVGLTRWGVEPRDGRGTSYYHSITGASNSVPPPEDGPLPARHECHMYTRTITDPAITVNPRSGLSMAIEFTGRNEDFEDTRLMLYHLRLRSFYPSSDPSGKVLRLDSQSTLKSSTDDSQDRSLYNANRNVLYFNMTPMMELEETEFASAFLELKENRVDLVVAVWGERFEGKLVLEYRGLMLGNDYRGV